MSSERILIVGAGLVGSLLALQLAQRGHRITVLERRPDMRKERISAGRSINLAISARGLHALSRVGLAQEALAHAIPMHGRMVHARDGSQNFQRYGKDGQHINSISRAWLNSMLMSHAEATGKVEIRFHQRLVDWADGGRTLTVRDERSGVEQHLEADLTFGTDGAGSAVREKLVAHGVVREHTERLAHGYKELEIPARAGGGFALEKHALHIWPRGHYMLIALPNQDGSFTCTLFLGYEGSPSFAQLTDEAALHALFDADFADAKALMPTLVQDFFANPTGHMVTVKSAPWHHRSTLLLGDAAHAIVPFFGQGMNCGFEDITALGELLDQGGDWPAVAAALDQQRKPNADAIADMAVENFVEMRDKTSDPTFVLHKAIEQRLFQAFPERFLSRYTLVSFSLDPYAYAYRVGQIAQGIVEELAQGLHSAEQVDLQRAGQLIDERLVPLLQQRA